MKPIRIVRHARRRMVHREITQEEIEAVLRQPQRVAPSLKGRQNVFGPSPGGWLRVTFLETADEVIVIAAVRQRGAGRGTP